VNLRGPRLAVLAGALVTAAGLVVAAMAPVVGTAPVTRVQAQQVVGGGIILVGWAILAWSIHRLGRMGP
jgi:hypothetical protein